MYQQYSQYHQQQQQQHSQFSDETVMVWNGTSWESCSGVINSSNNRNNVTERQQRLDIPTNPVQTYTQYYHGWIAHEKSLAEKLQQLKEQQQAHQDHEHHRQALQQLETEKQWAKYYADESSRAAHHFYQNPDTSIAPPFDLPPAPPSPGSTSESTVSNKVGNNDQQNQQQKQQQQRGGVATPNNNSSISSPSSVSNTISTNRKNRKGKYNEGSLTRYLKRNLELCRDNEKEKKRVQSEIEKKIASAIQEGTLQSRNWDLEPMIVVSTEVVQDSVESSSEGNDAGRQKQDSTKTASASPTILNVQQQQQHQPSQKTNYYGNYGPSKSSSPVSLLSSSYLNRDKNNYYGPASSEAITTPAHSSSKRTHNHYGNSSSSSHNTSYYGPATNDNDSTDMKKNNNISSSFASFSMSSPLQKQNKNHVQDRKRQWDITTAISSTSSMHDRRQDDYSIFEPEDEEDFMALPGYKQKQQQKYKKPRKSKLVATKVVPVDGMDASQEAMSKRANRFSSLHKSGIDKNSTSPALSDNYDKYMGKGLIGGGVDGSTGELEETDYEHMTVKGTSTTLEKDYLRLTAPPRPELVRPLGILQEHLKSLKQEYYDLDDDMTSDKNKTLLYERERTPQVQWLNAMEHTESESPVKQQQQKIRYLHRRHDYLWFCSQLKAVRQDCTVQRIQGEFAVDVYETHARIALQEGDLNEYNQCQTQLKELYKTCPSVMDTSKKDKDTVKADITADNANSWKNENEFIAYRLLYYVYLSTNEKYSGGSSDMFHIMLSLSESQREHPAISHALQVREAVACSDYFNFFRLLSFQCCPNLGTFLTDLLVPSIRMRGLRRIAKAYRPSIELIVCLNHLGIVKDDGTNEVDDHDDAIQRGKEWMIACGAVISDEGRFVTKDSIIHEPVTIKKNSLI